MHFEERETQAMKDGRRNGTVIGFRKASTGELFILDAAKQRWLLGSDSSCDLRMHSDPFVSGVHCVLERLGDGALYVRDRNSRNGTYVDGNQVEGARLAVGAYLTVGRTTLVAVSKPNSGEHERRSAIETLRSKDPTMRMIIEQGIRAAQTDCSVLIVGETGTGKDVMARLIHESSRRSEEPFVAVNCGAIPSELIASELFGHERGAFTGAADTHDGYFAQADGGTLFLDEIGELPIDMQPSLLRILETRRVRRVGGNADRHVNVRIVAATNRIEHIGTTQMTRMRLDLYHRIATMVLILPPLRDRMMDLPDLVEDMLTELEPDFGRKQITEEGWKALAAHSWPGNIRELRHAVARAVTLGDENLGPRDFFQDMQLAGRAVSPGPYQMAMASHDDNDLVPHEAMLRDAMRQALRQHGTIRAAAQALGMPKSTFADRAKEWGLITRRRPRFPQAK